MQPSTWHQSRCSRAIAAMAGMGSMRPWGQLGADPTMATVSGVTSAAMAATSARQSGPWGSLTASRPSRAAALLKAGWAERGRMMRGRPRTGRVAAAQSRAVFMARMLDSVPPVVRQQWAPSGASTIPSTIPSISLNNRLKLGWLYLPSHWSLKNWLLTAMAVAWMSPPGSGQW